MASTESFYTPAAPPDGRRLLVEFVREHEHWRLYLDGKPLSDPDEAYANSGPANGLNLSAGRMFDLANGEQVLLSLNAERLDRRPRQNGGFYAALNTAFSAGPDQQMNGTIEECSAWLDRWAKTLTIIDEVIKAKDMVHAYKLIHGELGVDHVSALIYIFELPKLLEGSFCLQLLQVSRAYGKPPKVLADFAQDQGWELGSRGPLHWYAPPRRSRRP